MCLSGLTATGFLLPPASAHPRNTRFGTTGYLKLPREHPKPRLLWLLPPCPAAAPTAAPFVVTAAGAGSGGEAQQRGRWAKVAAERGAPGLRLNRPGC